ncbi:MAG TPA: hypothetical protein VG537_10095 [Candidatus Kapabacteria bacterium]|jgi:hypothetical protein|nr:hypothetical protein [Candidatus Kapabacteria bacterium]
MIHETHAIRTVQVVGPHALRLTFEDGIIREVDLDGIFGWELYRPLADPEFFKQVRLNTDFDPETLYHWEEYRSAWQTAPRELDLSE